MIIGRNKDSSRHSSFPLFKLILHSVICIRTLANLLQKESLFLYKQITSVSCIVCSFPSFFVTLSSHCKSPITLEVLQSKAQLVAILRKGGNFMGRDA